MEEVEEKPKEKVSKLQELDLLFREYELRCADLRDRFRQYGQLLLILATASGAVFAYALQPNRGVVFIIVPPLVIVWVTFVANNYHVTFLLKKCILFFEEQINTTLKELEANFRLIWFKGVREKFIFKTEGARKWPKSISFQIFSVTIFITILAMYIAAVILGTYHLSRIISEPEWLKEAATWVYGLTFSLLPLILLVIYLALDWPKWTNAKMEDVLKELKGEEKSQ